jgi:hypothetical protein
MTLVVARQINNEVYLIADTKFTPAVQSASSKSSSTYIGGLKLIILSPGICIGFANNTEFARRALEGIYDKNINIFDKNLLIDYFLNIHLLSVTEGNEVDFIIALILESEDEKTFIKEIFKISDSKVSWENATTYIGDNEAFNCFQNISHKGLSNCNIPTFELTKLSNNERPDFNQSLSTALFAMQGVIDNPKILNVDGVRTVVTSEAGQFKYAEYIQVKGIPIPVRNEPNSPLSFGGAPEGSEIKHVGMYSATGHGVFPVYWITGKFGIIYNPKECFKPKVISNITQDEFRLMVGEEISKAHQKALAYQASL